MDKVVWEELAPEQRDALVAEKVMGLRVVSLSNGVYVTTDEDDNITGNPKPYTTEMNAAMEIITSNKFYSSYIHYMRAQGTVLASDQHMASLYWIGDKGGVCHVNAEGSTAREAICIAALRAYGVEVEGKEQENG